MTHAETIEYLCRLEATRGWDLKLERVRAALAALGNPERRYPSVLIAGTNGKGTVAGLTAAALQASGSRVGLYTSPHLVHFEERIRTDGVPLATETVVEIVEQIRSVLDPESCGLTFFEVATLIALQAFADHEVEVAVLEVGLGGRLDATNAVEPVASAIVSIDLDHQQWLGDSLAEIAREKAGVMRKRRPVIIGAGMADAASAALEECAETTSAEWIPAGIFAGQLGMPGCHMQKNAAVAAGLLDVLARDIPALGVAAAVRDQAFAALRVPGRMSRFRMGAPLVVDGAHNPAAVEALRATLAARGEAPYRLVFGALTDKPWPALGRSLAEPAEAVAVVPIANSRAVAPEDLRAGLGEIPDVRVRSSVQAAVEEFARESSEAPVLVAGSLFLVGELYAEALQRGGYPDVFAIEEGAVL